MEESRTIGAEIFPEDAAAAKLYDELIDQLAADEVTPQQRILIGDIVQGERMKAQLRADIDKRGIGAETWNGRQKQYRENKSIATHVKLSDQQRRAMMALGLIAREKGTASGDAGDDFDEF